MSTPDRQHETTVIERIEADIVAKLADGMGSSAYIGPFPGNPDTFDFAGYKVCALVHFDQGQYGQPKDAPVLSQPRALSFTIVLVLNDLGRASGAYRHLEDIRKALQGQRLDGCGPVRMVSERLMREAQGRWEYNVKIAVPALAVAARVAPRAHTHAEPETI